MKLIVGTVLAIFLLSLAVLFYDSYGFLATLCLFGAFFAGYVIKFVANFIFSILSSELVDTENQTNEYSLLVTYELLNLNKWLVMAIPDNIWIIYVKYIAGEKYKKVIEYKKDMTKQ